MNMYIERLRDKVRTLQIELADAEAALKFEVSQCKHSWTDPVAAHIRHEGYTIPGDPPGTMGIDWRGPTYVEPKTEKRWKRNCRICGEVEYTTKTTTQVTERPSFD